MRETGVGGENGKRNEKKRERKELEEKRVRRALHEAGHRCGSARRMSSIDDIPQVKKKWVKNGLEKVLTRGSTLFKARFNGFDKVFFMG